MDVNKNEDVLIAGLSNGSTTAPECDREVLQRVYAMAKGEGEGSYSKNSGYQASLTKMHLVFLDESLKRVTIPSKGGPVVVAELGSSSGRNSIDNVAFVVDKLRQRLPEDAEFQIYLNDLPSNDFNNLFMLLSDDSRAKNFYAAGVPGSYFGRLFAQSSVHVFYSYNSLHWLSKMPDAVLDKDSPAYNKGQTWIRHERSAVAKSYQQQASLDLKNFLQARAVELVPGGLLIIICCATQALEPNQFVDDATSAYCEDLNESFSDLVAEGLLTEEQCDTFNLALYYRSVEDVKEGVASCGDFDIMTATVNKTEMSPAEVFATSDTEALSKKIVGLFRGANTTTMEAHFGKEITEVIWQRFEKVYEKKIVESEDYKIRMDVCTACLIRK